MSKISTYEVTPVPKLADKLIGTSVGGEIEDITYNFTLSELLNLFIPNIPANTLQGVLDYGNEATQDIILNGTIFTTYIEVTDTATILNSYLTGDTHILGGLYDSLDSIGTAGQVLISTGDGIEWYSVPTITPDLQQVLTSGNTADVDIVLDANLEAIVVSANAAVIGSQLTVQGTLMDYNESTGTSGQVLASNSTTVQWIDLPVYSALSPLHIDTITHTLSIQQAGSTQNGYLSSADWISFDGKQSSISLTTVGSSGPASLVGTTINVPNYTLSGLGGVPQTRTLTINGVTYNLSADRSWTLATGVSSVSATTPLFSTGGVNPDISIQQSSSSLDGYLSNVDWLTFNSKQPAGNYITSLTGEATAAGPGAAAVTLSNAAVIGKLLTGLNITGGTVVSTDSILTAFGKVQNQINGLVGGVIYKGVWNAATNTPTLVSSVGVQGNYYIVNVAGNTNLNGITDWNVGDWAIFNGSTWNKVDNTDLVTSVNGQVGAVSLTTDNIPEGATNLYYLDSRARAALSFAAGSGAYNSTTGVITIPTDNSQILNGAGYITLVSLSATSPLSYNNLTGAFSIQVANTTQNGYLSSTDWNTFNGKQPFLGGTGLVKSVAGVISYITDNSANWNTAYDNMIVSAAVTGTSTKTLTLNQQDAGTITASWTDLGLTSVGVSMPSAFSVSGSPLTSNGTISITGAGTTLEYIDGTGALRTFPILTGYVPYTGATTNVNLGIYNLTAASLIKSGGTSSQFLKADGSVDSSAYIVLGSLSATAPLSYNSTTGAFTISQAGTASNGYLSSTDWNTFNDKQPFITAGTTLQYYRGDKTFQTLNTTVVPEGTNLYYTNARTIASTLTGYVSGAGTITSADSLLTAIQKLNGNIGGLTTGVSSVFGRTGAVIAVSGDYTTTLVPEGTNLYYLDSRARAALSFAAGSGAYNSTTGVITIPTNNNQIANGANYITLGSLSATAPLSYNNTTGAFSISQSGASTDGYLSSTDWNTFNNKQPAGSYVPTSRQLTINGTAYDLSADRSWSVGTVTSVAALTLGTTGTDLSSSVATGTTTPVITLNVPTASAANRGALSAADWSTFNTKVGGVTATSPLFSSGGSTPNITIQQSSGSQAGYLSAADWTTFNNKQAAGNYITSLTGEATASGPGAASVTLSNSAVTAKVLTGINITGGTVVDTDSILTGFGKLQNQINSLVGSTIYKGTWNASTNVPALASGVGTRGWYYIVSVAGTTNLDGITDWFIGDWAIFDGTAWQQVDNTDAVVSVNGQTGAVSLTTDNIPEGATNQYFLNSRARAALSFTAGSGAYNSTTGVITIPTNTSQLTNGANFITLASLSGTAPISYNSGTGAISITQSGTASNGYLSSTDWNTFNNKQATITLTTTGTSGAATLVGATLNIPQYQSVITNPVTGTGTTNYVARWTSTSAISTGVLIDDGTNVGINETSPNNKLYVSAGSGTPGFNIGVTIKTANGTYTTGDGGMLQFQNEDVISAGIRGVRASGWGSSLIFYVHNPSSGNTFGTTFVPVLTLNESLNAIFVGTATATQFNSTSSSASLPAFAVSSGNGMYNGGTNILNFSTNSSAALSISPTQAATFYSVGQFQGYALSGDFGANYTIGLGVGMPGTSPNKGINIGWNNVADFGFIGAVQNGTAWKTLVLQPVGGAVYVGATANSSLYSGYIGLGGTDPQERLAIYGGNIKFNTAQNVAGQYTYIGTEYSVGNGNNKTEIRFGIESDTYTKISFWTANGAGNIGQKLNISSAGIITVANLAGTGSRIVVADASGNLSASSALSGYIDGSGTTNYLPKFTGTSTIGNSAFYDGGGFGGFNSTGLGARTFIIQAANARPLALEMIEYANVHAVYVRPNNSGYNLISSNYISGGVYIPLALSGRENSNDLVIWTDGNTSIGQSSNAGYKLDVNGTGRIGNTANGSTADSLLLHGKGVTSGGIPYGDYGSIVLSADSSYTSGARRFLITNGYNATRFAIIQSVDSTTTPTLGAAGAVTSGILIFSISNTGSAEFSVPLIGTSATFSSTLTAQSNIDLTGDLRYQSNAGFGLKSQNGTRLFEVYNTGISFVTALTGTSASFSSTITANGLVLVNGSHFRTSGAYTGNQYYNAAAATNEKAWMIQPSGDHKNFLIGTMDDAFSGMVQQALNITRSGTSVSNISFPNGTFNVTGAATFSSTLSVGSGTYGVNFNVTSSNSSNSFTGGVIRNSEISGAIAGMAFMAYDWVQGGIWHGRGATSGKDGALVLGTNPDTSILGVGGLTGRVFIFNNGNVSINNQADGGYKFYVNGTGYFSSSLTVGNGINLANQLTYNNNTYSAASPFEFLKITYGGGAYCGIKMTVYNPVNSIDSNLGFSVMNSSGTYTELLLLQGSARQAYFKAAINTDSTLYVTSTATIAYSGLSGDFGAGYTTGMGVGYSSSISKGINMGWNTTYDMGFIGTVHNGTAWKSLTLCPIGGAVYIGITGNNSIYAGAFYEGSDKRLKQIIEDDYKAVGVESVKARLYTKEGKLEIGYYAQDFESILPSAVSKNDAGFLSLSYTQVHTAKIAIIEDEVDVLKRKVTELESKLQKYEA